MEINICVDLHMSCIQSFFQNEDKDFLLILQIISISASGAKKLYYVLCVSSINIKKHYLKSKLEEKMLM